MLKKGNINFQRKEIKTFKERKYKRSNHGCLYLTFSAQREHKGSPLSSTSFSSAPKRVKEIKKDFFKKRNQLNS